MKRFTRSTLLLMAVLVGLSAVAAAVGYKALEVENGLLAGTAASQSDAAAAGGSAVKFAAAGSIPAQCAAGGAYVWANLVACGWPGPTNTGYPAGTALTTTTSRTITTNGTVIDGQQINGSLTINADNVIIRNSLINYSGSGGGGSGAIKILAGASAIIDHVEVDGNSAVHACVWHEGDSATITFLKCHDMEDAVFSWAQGTGSAISGDNLTLEDSYIYAFNAVESNGHFDGYQTEGASHGVLRHNTIDMGIDGNSAVAIWNGQKTSDDWTVENNLMAGGGFTVYAEDYHPSEATNTSPNNPVGGFAVTNVRFTGNKFSNKYGSCVGGYGIWFFRSAWTYQGGPTGGWGANGNVRSGNVIIETGQNVDSGNPNGCN